ncbi:hypothetical protein DAI22_08g068101 [Oryza sativa Japonica Group]|nr:hypothetical protein DAI22_08g068101 [Oryza sativa Japonica Group]
MEVANIYSVYIFRRRSSLLASKAIPFPSGQCTSGKTQPILLIASDHRRTEHPLCHSILAAAKRATLLSPSHY